jgi:hypothetical protein
MKIIMTVQNEWTIVGSPNQAGEVISSSFGTNDRDTGSGS